MGQTTSNPQGEAASKAEVSSSADDHGVLFVQGTGSQVPETEIDEQIKSLLQHSQSLYLPHPILPPPPVKDDIQSALQGAQVMHDIKSVLGGFLGTDDTAPDERNSDSESKEQERSVVEEAVRSTDGDESITARVGADPRLASSIDEFTKVSEQDLRAEQDRWKRLGINAIALQTVIEECTGGEPLIKVIDRQEKLMQQIEDVKVMATRMKQAMTANGEQARRTTKAAEKLDRIHVTLSGVQDTLESAVATANILGASHFAHNEEMCSFKNFLKQNPPRPPS